MEPVTESLCVIKSISVKVFTVSAFDMNYSFLIIFNWHVLIGLTFDWQIGLQNSLRIIIYQSMKKRAFLDLLHCNWTHQKICACELHFKGILPNHESDTANAVSPNCTQSVEPTFQMPHNHNHINMVAPLAVS